MCRCWDGDEQSAGLSHQGRWQGAGPRGVLVTLPALISLWTPLPSTPAAPAGFWPPFLFFGLQQTHICSRLRSVHFPLRKRDDILKVRVRLFDYRA